MAGNFFSSFFKRPITRYYVYDRTVPEPIVFKARSFLQLEDLYTTVVEVRIIEDFIADFISRIPAGVEDAKGNPVKYSKLNQLVQQANTEQSFQELLKEFLVSYGLTGNGYMLFANDFLYNLPTSTIEVILGANVEVPEWRNYIHAYRQEYEGYEYVINEDLVLHMKTANMGYYRGSWAYGSSPYSSAEQNLQSIIASNSARVATMRDRGALGFLTNDSEFPDKDATEDAKKKIEAGGIMEDQDKIFVTTQKLRYQSMALDMEQLQILNNLSFDFDKLCELRGIDPMIFSAQEATYANQTEAYKGTVKRALLPLTYHFYDKFNLWIKEHMATTNKLVPNVKELPDYSDLGTEQSTRITAEVREGIMSREQALEILYPDLTWEEDTPQMVQVVEANRGNSSSEDKFTPIKIYK